MGHLLQYVLNGLAKGSIYSLIALGLVVIYRGTGHLNFAQGEMALFATFGAWWINDHGVPLAFAILLAAAFAFVGGGAIEYGLMRPAGKKSPFAVVVVAIGLFQALNSLSGMLFEGAGTGLAFGTLFEPTTTSSQKASALALLQEVQYRGKTQASPSDPLPSYKIVIGDNAARLDLLRQAFTAIMQDGMQVALIQ